MKFLLTAIEVVGLDSIDSSKKYLEDHNDVDIVLSILNFPESLRPDSTKALELEDRFNFNQFLREFSHILRLKKFKGQDCQLCFTPCPCRVLYEGQYRLYGYLY